MQLSLSSATKSAKSLSFLCKTGSMFNRFSSVSCQVFTKLYLFQIFTKFQILTKYIYFRYLPIDSIDIYQIVLISYQVGKNKSHLPFDPQKSHTTPLDPSALGENRKGWSMMCAEWSQIMPWYPWFFWMRLLEFHYWYPILISYDIPAKNIQQIIPWLSWHIP